MTQPNLQFQHMVNLVKFLEELSNMKRLSSLELAQLKPSFDAVVQFLNFQQQQLNQNNTVEVASDDEIDIDSIVSKKKHD